MTCFKSSDACRIAINLPYTFHFLPNYMIAILAILLSIMFDFLYSTHDNNTFIQQNVTHHDNNSQYSH